MKIVLFCHAFTSCWNNGHAHFLRGVARELVAMGHHMVVCEPSTGWSRVNALADGGATVLAEAERLVPGVELHRYPLQPLDIESKIDEVLGGADIVLVHEWNEPLLISTVGRRRGDYGSTLFYLDAHHRAVTAPKAIEALELDAYDGVLAFGETLRDVYSRRGWGRRAYTWHEAADTTLFRPLTKTRKNCDLIWVGNWGDEERSHELQEFLIGPAADLGLAARVYGVRYPDYAARLLARANIAYGGWLPNHQVPAAFAAARLTVHIPRQTYNGPLSGIPTIRVFEALACGIPLVCSPWSDEEALFPPGSYLQVRGRAGMNLALSALLADSDMASEFASKGLAAIEHAHTCRHRVQELLSIAASISGTDQRAFEPAGLQPMEPSS
jgi:spore maturation protein CgeB